MPRARLFLATSLFAALLVGCASSGHDEAIKAIAKTHAPDTRTEVFEIHLEKTDVGTRLRGTTTSRTAYEALKALHIPSEGITLLPDVRALNGKTKGYVSVPVATLYKEPHYRSAVQTQAVLGTPLEILQGTNWRQVRLPDGYIAWMPREQLVTMSPEAFTASNATEWLMVTANEAVLRSAPSPNARRLMLLAMGTRLSKHLRQAPGWTCVRLPDARFGYLKDNEVASVRDVLTHWDVLRSDSNRYKKALTALSYRLLGQSYLWAGTSSFGMDCSGFVQTVFLRTGIVLPRDADQQSHAGKRLDDVPQVGDLLFFGKRYADGSEAISHVALSLGGARFIHSRGFVRLGSLDAVDPEYDAYEKGRFLFAIRPDLATLPRILP